MRECNKVLRFILSEEGGSVSSPGITLTHQGALSFQPYPRSGWKFNHGCSQARWGNFKAPPFKLQNPASGSLMQRLWAHYAGTHFFDFQRRFMAPIILMRLPGPKIRFQEKGYCPSHENFSDFQLKTVKKGFEKVSRLRPSEASIPLCPLNRTES